MSLKNKTPYLALLALGIVFGNIGTSPIYAFQASVTEGQSNQASIYGVVSLIFWALTIVVTLKYLTFIVRADNKGEGGIMALFPLLPDSIRHPQKKLTLGFYFAMMMGAAFLFGDGILTPSISVLSAVEGTGVINPNWVHLEVPITVIILVILFAIQFKGTGKIGALFGPITLIWFITIGTLGVRQILKHPGVLEALSPTYALIYISHEGFHTLIILSSVILAITGVEALYADMGHFGVRAVRTAWLLIAAPALILNYLGQAAEEIVNPKSASALFFGMAPNHASLIFLVIIATAATIIASQALISGVGSITQQAINLGIFPRFKVIHTSKDQSGQIYVPLINTMVGVGSVLLVVIFKSFGRLANAYSFDIAGTMLITTVAFYIVAVKKWGWNTIAVSALMGFLGVIDLGFFASTSTKILKGAWVPLCISLVIVYFIWVWRKGQLILSKMILKEATSWDAIESLIESGKAVETPNVGVFLTSSTLKVPQALTAQIKNLHSVPQKIVVVSVNILDKPHADANGTRVLVNNRVTQVSIDLGYFDPIDVPKMLGEHCLSKEELLSATYYLSDRKFNNANSGDMRGIEEKVFTFLHRNSAPVGPYFGLPEERLVTLGIQIDL
jgi:KUP system potassium uptake protein